MVKKIAVVLAVMLGISIAHCFAEDDAGVRGSGTGSDVMASSEATKVDSQLSKSVNAFGLSLFRQLVRVYPSQNVFISPLSVSAALGMAYNGAGGETREQIKQALSFSGLTPEQINQSYQQLFSYPNGLDSNVRIEIANSIWYDARYTVKDGFIETNHKYFDAEITPLNFKSGTAADIINSWVNRSTHGKVSRIVEKPLDPLMAMSLINAVYFKGTWTNPFQLTTGDFFLSSSGAKQPIMMMHITNSMKYYDNPELQMVDLPYGEGTYSMTIILPRQDMDINQFVLSLTEERLNDWMMALSMKAGSLALPRFKLEYETSLNEALQLLGIQDAFDARKADFSGMSDNTGLVISNVKHKTFVEVNEIGTEAAAVTGETINVGPGPEPFVMNVNRPFVYMIRDRDTNTILFIGRVTGLGA
ncbi:MAG: serpin family protein [Candidatus Zixiibacteriota bacterium]